MVVVGLAVSLQEKAQKEDRLLERARDTKQKRNEQPAQATVAVQKRVNRLELNVYQPSFYQGRQTRRLFVKKTFERCHAVHYQLRWRGHEEGVTRSRSTDPILTATKLAGFFVAASPTCEQHSMDLADKPQR